MEKRTQTEWLKLFEMLEGVLVPRGPITFRGSKFRISFLKNYFKYSPLIFALLVAGFIAWAVYLGTTLIWLAVGVGILVGVFGYASFWVGAWLVKKFFISNIIGYQKVFKPESTVTNKVKTYIGLRVFLVFIGIIAVISISGVLFHYRGFLGLIISILIYLPSLSITLWVMERAMEIRPFVPSRISYRIVIVAASIFVQIFFLWWLLEIGKDLWGGLGIGITLIIFFSFLLLYYYTFKRKKQQKIEKSST